MISMVFVLEIRPARRDGRARIVCVPATALQFRRERQKRDILRAFNRNRQPALMTRARAGHSPRENLAALLNERLENLRLLVVDQIDFIDAEAADFLFANVVAFSAARPGRPAASGPASTGRSSTG